jgi:hypothetical protein
VLLFLLPPLVSLCLRITLLTCRLEIRNPEHLTDEIEGHGKALVAFWHEVLALAMWRYRGAQYHTLTSYSYDGELAARVVRKFGLQALRGSSSRGGGEALHQMERALNMGITVGFTLDGPRGPRRVAKPGIAVIAGRSQTSVVPCAFVANRAWRLRSWDRFIVPKPFARMLCVCGPPIPPPTDDSPETVDRYRLQIEETLNTLHAALELEFGVTAD